MRKENFVKAINYIEQHNRQFENGQLSHRVNVNKFVDQVRCLCYQVMVRCQMTQGIDVIFRTHSIASKGEWKNYFGAYLKNFLILKLFDKRCFASSV